MEAMLQSARDFIFRGGAALKNRGVSKARASGPNRQSAKPNHLSTMIRFLYPQFLFLLALLPLIALLRGRRGTVAALKYSNAIVAAQAAGSARSACWRLASSLSGWPVRNLATTPRPLMPVGWMSFSPLDCSVSMEALDFKLDGRRPANRIDVVKSVAQSSLMLAPTGSA